MDAGKLHSTAFSKASIRLKALLKPVYFVVLVLVAAAFVSPALGQIYVANQNTGVLASYSTNGVALNTNLISGGLVGVANDASWQFYVTYPGIHGLNNGSVAIYSSSGVPINTNLIHGLDTPFAVALDGNGIIYVVSYEGGNIGKYTTTGSVINSYLIAGLSFPNGMALDGNGNIYIASGQKIKKYTTSGQLVNASLISVSSPYGVAVDTNGYLYVSSYYAGIVGKYLTDGTVVNASLITGLTNACSITIGGNGHLYVGCQGVGPSNGRGLGTIGEYTASGDAVNATLINGLSSPYYVTIISTPKFALPSPVASLIKAVKPAFTNLLIGIQYQMQVSGDLNTWTNQGSVFTATNNALVWPQYWDVDNWDKLFFRMQAITP